MLYGWNGPQRIPGVGSPPAFQPGVTSSAPKTPPNVNYMRQQIAGAMAQPQMPQQPRAVMGGIGGNPGMTALPHRF